MQQATVKSHCMYPSCPEGHQHTAWCLPHLCSHASQIRSFHCTCHLERGSVQRTVEWDYLLNLQNILITLTWLPVTPILCALHSDVLLQKLTNGVLITRHTKTQISCTDFFDYVFLTVAYIPLHDDLPTTSIMYGYYFIWQPLVVTLHHMQYNN